MTLLLTFINSILNDNFNEYKLELKLIFAHLSYATIWKKMPNLIVAIMQIIYIPFSANVKNIKMIVLKDLIADFIHFFCNRHSYLKLVPPVPLILICQTGKIVNRFDPHIFLSH